MAVPEPDEQSGAHLLADTAEPRLSRRARRRGRARSRSRRLAEWAVILLVAAAVAFVVRSYVVQTFYIPSTSMTPTLLEGDRILVDKLPWVRDNIHRGDIVVFRRVADDPQVQDTDLVKRVIGLPGETISSRGDTIYIDGKAIKQPWLPNLKTPLGRKDSCPEVAYGIKPQTVPAGQYFVMGDCRGISYDSRYWGTVPAANIIGKVFLVIWRNDHPYFDWF